jgi:transposase
MLDFSQDCTVYMACGVTDLRKSFHGLTAIVKLKFNLDPYSRCMFAFCNRNRSLIKILRWDGSGFWLLMKRIDKGFFNWPNTPEEVKQISLKELRWITEGLSLEQKSAFKERHPKIIV